MCDEKQRSREVLEEWVLEGCDGVRAEGGLAGEGAELQLAEDDVGVEIRDSLKRPRQPKFQLHGVYKVRAENFHGEGGQQDAEEYGRLFLRLQQDRLREFAEDNTEGEEEQPVAVHFGGCGQGFIGAVCLAGVEQEVGDEQNWGDCGFI